MADFLSPRLSPPALARLLALLFCLPSTSLGAEPPPDLFERPVHTIVENQRVVNELGKTPLPMVDWGTILAGQVVYVDRETGRKLPLNDPHELDDPAQVRAVPICVPSGIRLWAQPATKGGTFAEELFPPEFPWEENCTVHTLLYDEADL